MLTAAGTDVSQRECANFQGADSSETARRPFARKEVTEALTAGSQQELFSKSPWEDN